MNSKKRFVLCCLIIFFAIQETPGMIKRLFSSKSSSSDASSSAVSAASAKRHHYTREGSVQPRNFFEVIDQFETMEVKFTTITASDKISLLERQAKGLPLTDIKSYVEKTLSLECAYDFAALYVLYHVKQMYDDKHFCCTDLKHVLAQYSKQIHRMLLISYMLEAPILPATWFVAIFIDTLHKDYNRYTDKEFHRIYKLFVAPLKSCHKRGKIDRKIILLKDVEKTNFYYVNDKLFSRLGVAPASDPLHLFGTEERFDVYLFFHMGDDINAKFAPPSVWFETYETYILDDLYREVQDTWKKNSFVLCKYTNAVRNLVLMTTYYALLKHCRFLMATWYILVERVCLSEPSLRPGMREERKKLMQVPVPVVEMIFYNLNSPSGIGFLPTIEDNLNIDQSSSKDKLEAFVRQGILVYNSYAIKIGADELNYDIWEDWPQKEGFEIQTQFFHDDPDYPTFETAIMESVNILQSYYNAVLETLSPTDFAAIDCLASTEIKKTEEDEEEN